MTTAAPASPAVVSSAGPRPITRRIGLVLAAVLSVLSAVSSVSEIGFDGSGWDVAVVLLAVGLPLIALGTIVFGIFAWNGRRTPSLVVIVLQVIGLLQVLPPVILVAVGFIPAFVLISLVVSTAATVLAIVFIARGMRPRG